MNTTITRRSTRRRAFTLIELLTVIVIIILLVSLLAPSVNQAIKQSYLARTRAQIQNLERGLEAFKYENRFYPGQTDKTGKWHITDGGPANTGKFQNLGSEFLARALWMSEATSGSTNYPGTPGILDTSDPDYVTQFNKPWQPKTTPYAAYDSSMLTDNKDTTTYNGTISDGFKGEQQMPILYFVANLNEDDEQQFLNGNTSSSPPDGTISMNFKYAGEIPQDSDTSGTADAKRKGHVKKYMNARGLWPKVKDKYLLIAPGLDREYFGKDDITN